MKKNPSKTQNPKVPKQIEDVGNAIKNSTKTILRDYLLFSFLLISAGLIVLYVFPDLIPQPQWVWSTQAPDLSNTTTIKFLDGDSFHYIANDGKTTYPYKITATKQLDCPGIWLIDKDSAQAFYGSLSQAEIYEPGVYKICIGDDGWQIDSDSNHLGSLISFENTSWPFFSPWMLALNDNLEFRANRTLQINNAPASKIVFDFNVLESISYRGRQAYVVQIQNIDNQSTNPSSVGLSMPSDSKLLLYIDKEYRILLHSQSSDTTLDLIKAPFELENYSLHSFQ
jgi:hypothetical protein